MYLYFFGLLRAQSQHTHTHTCANTHTHTHKHTHTCTFCKSSALRPPAATSSRSSTAMTHVCRVSESPIHISTRFRACVLTHPTDLAATNFRSSAMMSHVCTHQYIKQCAPSPTQQNRASENPNIPYYTISYVCSHTLRVNALRLVLLRRRVKIGARFAHPLLEIVHMDMHTKIY